jgi:hypothetical protein
MRLLLTVYMDDRYQLTGSGGEQRMPPEQTLSSLEVLLLVAEREATSMR